MFPKKLLYFTNMQLLHSSMNNNMHKQKNENIFMYQSEKFFAYGLALLTCKCTCNMIFRDDWTDQKHLKIYAE